MNSILRWANSPFASLRISIHSIWHVKDQCDDQSLHITWSWFQTISLGACTFAHNTTSAMCSTKDTNKRRNTHTIHISVSIEPNAFVYVKFSHLMFSFHRLPASSQRRLSPDHVPVIHGSQTNKCSMLAYARYVDRLTGPETKRQPAKASDRQKR